jgi:protein dithiol oxidoreductase (disulfide-forming)
VKTFTMVGAILLSWGSMGFAQTGTAELYQEGIHYLELKQVDPARISDTIIVTEIFSYGCIACNDFEPFMQDWKGRQAEDIKLDRIPVGFGRPTWELLAKAYLIAEIMGIEEEAHVHLMNTIWQDGREFRSLEDLADFYSEFGVGKQEFMAMDNGFALDMRQNLNATKLNVYSPRSTPTMIVDGKYKVRSSDSVPSYQAMLSVVDFLVEKERKARMSALGCDFNWSTQHIG